MKEYPYEVVNTLKTFAVSTEGWYLLPGKHNTGEVNTDLEKSKRI